MPKEVDFFCLRHRIKRHLWRQMALSTPSRDIFDQTACEVVSTMAGSFAVALADRNIAELVKHSTDTIQVGRDDLGLVDFESKGCLFNRRMKAQTVWQCVFLYQMTFCFHQRISCFREVNRFQAVNFPPVFNWTVWEGEIWNNRQLSLSSPSCNKNPGTLRQSKQENWNQHQAIQQPQLLWQNFLRSPAHGFLHGFQQQQQQQQQ